MRHSRVTHTNKQLQSHEKRETQKQETRKLEVVGGNKEIKGGKKNKQSQQICRKRRRKNHKIHTTSPSSYEHPLPYKSIKPLF